MEQFDHFPRAWFNEVFNDLLHRLNKKSFEIRNKTWIYWHKKFKDLFLKGFLITEITGAFDEAFQKKHWPEDNKFWDRVEDVALKNRRELSRIPAVRVDTGPQPLKDLLSRAVDKNP